MSDIERPRPMFINLQEDGSVKPVEVPNLDELLGERIHGLAPDTRAFLKLQMLMRDQDVIGRIFSPRAILEMLEDLAGEGTITPDHAVDLYNAAHATHDAFREETVREAEELGIPISTADPSRPKNLQ